MPDGVGVAISHSRPRVSDDTPCYEAQLKTLTYHASFPNRFGSLEDGKSFVVDFFTLLTMPSDTTCTTIAKALATRASLPHTFNLSHRGNTRHEYSKGFWCGRSQAIRLPKEFRFDTDEVSIRRQGEMLILEPLSHEWVWLEAVVGSVDDDFAAAAEESPSPQSRLDLDFFD